MTAKLTDDCDTYSESSWLDWIGQRVSIGGIKPGILRYFGKTHFADGLWCGVELDEPVGKHDGSIKNVRYFTCKDNHGIFAPSKKTEKIKNATYTENKEQHVNFKECKLLPSKISKKNIPHRQNGLNYFTMPSSIVKSNKYINRQRRSVFYDELPKTNFDDIPPKIRRHSERYQMNVENNPNTFQIYAKNEIISETSNISYKQRISLPLNISGTVPSQEDLRNGSYNLNETVILKNNTKPCNNDYNQNATFFCNKNNNILNTTFDLQTFKSCDVYDNKESTFICDKIKSKSVSSPTKKTNATEVNERQPSECDESLGILSESQMREFTLSDQVNPLLETNNRLLKMESCDEISDIPEFETDKSVFISNEANSLPFSLKYSEENNVKHTDCAQCDLSMKENANVNPYDNDILLNNIWRIENSTPIMSKPYPGVQNFSVDSPCLEGHFDESPTCTSTPARQLKSFTFHPKSIEQLQLTYNEIFYDTKSLNKEEIPSMAFRTSALDCELPFSRTSEFSSINFVDITEIERNLNSHNQNKQYHDVPNFFEQNEPKSIFKSSEHSVDILNKTNADLDHCADDSTILPINKCNILPVIEKLHMDSEAIEKDEIVSLVNKTNNINIVDNNESYTFYSALNEEENFMANKNQDDAYEAACFNNNDLNATFEMPLKFNVSNDTKFVNQIENGVKLNATANLQELLSDIDLIGSNLPDETSCAFKNEKHLNSDNCENFIYERSPNLAGKESCVAFLESKETTIEKQNQNFLNELNKTYESKDFMELTETDDTLTNVQKQIYEEKCQNVTYENYLLSDNKLKISDATYESAQNFVPVVNDTLCMKNTLPCDKQESNMQYSDDYNTVCNLTFDLLNQCDNINSENKILDKILPLSKGENKTLDAKKPPVEKKVVHTKNFKKVVVSKVKQMLESHENCSKNQENVKSVRSFAQNFKPGKWDNVEKKIAEGMSNEKRRRKEKKEIVSKVNTNLSAVRQSKINPPTVTQKSANPVENRRKSNMTSVKNHLIKQRKIDENTFAKPDLNSKENPRILTQLQNIESSAGHNDTFKVPQVRKREKILSKTQELTSPVDTASCASSNASSSSKIAMLQKCNINKGQKNVLQAGCIQKNMMKKPADTMKKNVPEKPTRYSFGESSTMKDSSLTKKQKTSGNDSKPPPYRGTPQSKLTKANTTPIAKSKPAPPPPRWNSIASKTPATEPRKKFVSKTELVKEIQRLTALCESRTKELSLLKVRLRHATLGLEAFAILNKYVTEEYNPFAQPHLAQEYEKAKEELYRAGAQLQYYQVKLDELRKTHADELIELSEKLGVVHSDEINELKMKHRAELEEVDFHHKQQIKNMKASFQKDCEENETQHCKIVENLERELGKQRQGLETAQAEKVAEMTRQHEEVRADLQKQLSDLRRQYDLLQKQVKEAEQAFLKDKNAKIQYMSSKKNDLEKEVDSLKTVLEMKSLQIQDLNKQNVEMRKELEELPVAREKIKKLETKTEDLKALMQDRIRQQRELSNENQQLVMICEKESKMNTRLSMANEELQWKLQQNKEASIRSSSISGSPEPWTHGENPFDSMRSSSRLSLPFLHSDMQRSFTADSPDFHSVNAEGLPVARHSMSLSWHPALPTHAEAEVCEKPPPPRQRSSSYQIRRQSYNAPSKMSSHKLKKDIEAEFLKRNANMSKSALSSHRSPSKDGAMSASWAGETIADLYEHLDTAYLQDVTLRQRTWSKVEDKTVDSYCNENKRSLSFKVMHGSKTDVHDLMTDITNNDDKSLVGISSMQSSFNSSSESSMSLSNQTNTEASNSSSSAENTKSNTHDTRNCDFYESESCVKSPRDLAGEAMIQDVDSLGNIIARPLTTDALKEHHQINGKFNDEILARLDETLSPEESREKANGISIGTTSLESSSLGMADSTNIDVSWGDEEMPSEHDS